ncbi:MAG TPA: FAD-dependent oxidoreductase, partial [Terriglobales bacterium]|nr:FAD-dependent oxidoreductase [Terriglobales bacterium]
TSRFVILGGGMVAGYAAKQMVELGLKPSELTIVSSDDVVPYERPPLSKSFLSGKDTEDAIKISPEDFYRQRGIDVKLSTEVSSLDAKGKSLKLKSGDELAFEKLVIATGARPRRLKGPGSQLKNLFYLRSMDDSKAIREQSEKAKRAVVIGGGFIGMEVTAVLAQRGLAVTMVLGDDRIWKRLFTPEMSKFFEDYYTAKGVRIVRSTTVKELRGSTAVTSTVTGDGQTIDCDLVVAGIGVEPVTDIFAGSGLAIDNGIVVNEYLETSAPDILAAGDVANYQDVLFNKRRRVEHWDNAVSQGQHCGRTLMGERAVFRHVPYFFSDVFDLSYEYWGDSSEADQVIHRGDLSGKSFSTWWLRGGRLVAAFVMSRPDEERDNASKWIEAKHAVSAEKLKDASQPIAAAAK